MSNVLLSSLARECSLLLVDLNILLKLSLLLLDLMLQLAVKLKILEDMLFFFLNFLELLLLLLVDQMSILQRFWSF